MSRCSMGKIQCKIGYTKLEKWTLFDFVVFHLIDVRLIAFIVYCCLTVGNEKNKEPPCDGTTLTIDEIVAQSFVFFVAGFETISTTMTFALYELSRNQEIQDKVRDEIDSVLKKHNNQITYDSLKELEYMGEVINETLRKYPPVPFVTRRCIEDYKLPDRDVVINKGTRIFIPITTKSIFLILKYLIPKGSA